MSRAFSFAPSLGSVLLVAVLGCASQPATFPLRAPLWRDPDRHVFEGKPAEYFSPLGWDAADQTFFRPIVNFFAVDPGGEAVNVNALDEVPNSSWFTNRIGLHAMSPEDVARGPCRPPETDPVEPWTVTGAKPNGANPGFLIKDKKGDRYLVKFDGTEQGPRATSADVIVSKIYHAAGFSTPCNQIVFFDRGILRIDPDAMGEDASGDEERLTEKHLDAVFQKAIRLPDGRYRASTSKFIDGEPIGPFTYQGRRDDDPNDVVNHEDRRELRASRLLAAWTQHFDAREQNTLGSFIEVSEDKGFVEHYLIDFGDSLGSVWEPPALGRRIGHAYYLDFGYLGEDFLTFGMVERPWEHARFGVTGPVFGYYDVRDFDPERWRPGYPNPAFSRMTERDAAWMARIIARLSPDHIRRLVQLGRFHDAVYERELTRILLGRREKILRRFLTRVSPLTAPRVTGGELCLEDTARAAELVPPRSYTARARLTSDLEPAASPPLRNRGLGPCIRLPRQPATVAEPAYLRVDVGVVGSDVGVARVHLYQLGAADYRVVALERPEGDPDEAGGPPRG